jgi:hypothetical protein
MICVSHSKQENRLVRAKLRVLRRVTSVLHGKSWSTARYHRAQLREFTSIDARNVALDALTVNR